MNNPETSHPVEDISKKNRSKNSKRKISITPITAERVRQVTLSKRKFGLMKKCYELSVLCNCDIGLMIFTPKSKLYQYASSDMDSILLRYMNYPQIHESKTSTDFEAANQKGAIKNEQSLVLNEISAATSSGSNNSFNSNNQFLPQNYMMLSPEQQQDQFSPLRSPTARQPNNQPPIFPKFQQQQLYPSPTQQPRVYTTYSPYPQSQPQQQPFSTSPIRGSIDYPALGSPYSFGSFPLYPPPTDPRNKNPGL